MGMQHRPVQLITSYINDVEEKSIAIVAIIRADIFE
jgi:hypothetical protein